MANNSRTTGTPPSPRGPAKASARTAGAGKQIDLTALVARKASTSTAPTTQADDRRTELTPRRLPVHKIAPNPLNREIDPDSPEVREMADSLRRFGQLSSSPVVSRMAFVAKFPELAERVGNAPYVQVNGGYRRAASLLIEAEDRQQLGDRAAPAELDIVVRNELVSSREEFVAATAAENLDRKNYNPIDEARAVALVVREAGAQDLAAERLNRSKGWVNHRMNLLKLTPPVQAAVAAGAIPLREARQMHTLPDEEQLAVLAELLAGARSDEEPTSSSRTATSEPTDPGQEPTTTGEESSVAPQPTRVRATRFAAAIKRLGQTPPKIADALTRELPKDALQELVTELQSRLGQE